MPVIAFPAIGKNINNTLDLSPRFEIIFTLIKRVKFTRGKEPKKKLRCHQEIPLNSVTHTREKNKFYKKYMYGLYLKKTAAKNLEKERKNSCVKCIPYKLSPYRCICGGAFFRRVSLTLWWMKKRVKKTLYGGWKTVSRLLASKVLQHVKA